MSVIQLTDATFEDEVSKYEGVVVVDFWAPWCGPCQMVSPIIDELADEMKDVKFCKVNVDEEGTLSEKFEIMSIPAVFIFKNGEVVEQLVGGQSKENYKSTIESVL